MTLEDQLRQQRAEAEAASRRPDHWLIRPDLLSQLKTAGLLGGSSYAGLWTFDDLPMRESNVPGERGFSLISHQF